MARSIPRRWSLDHNPLSGLTLGQWWKLLRENHFDIDFAYAHRAAFLTALSAFNSLCAAVERIRYGRAIGDTRVRNDPIFILGHWRSGTTHVHNLLACDDRLTFPTTFQVVNPSSFLMTQRVLPRVFRPLLPDRRPMDNMAMSFDAPQEDELALSLLSGMSPYMSLSFPRRAAHYDRYMTLADVPGHEVAEWKRICLSFVRKLSVGDGRRFVFKSPAHTGRIALLLEIFEKARFVHIRRDPYTVFQSSRHYFETAAWHANLQRLEPESFDAAIVERYDVLNDSYLAQRDLIPPRRLHELSYEALTADPIGEMRRLYLALDLEPFAAVEPSMREYLESIAGYQKNRHRPLRDDERRWIASAWGRYFHAFGYSTGLHAHEPPTSVQETRV